MYYSHFLSLYLNCAIVLYLLLSGGEPTVMFQKWVGETAAIVGVLIFYDIVCLFFFRLCPPPFVSLAAVTLGCRSVQCVATDHDPLNVYTNGCLQ